MQYFATKWRSCKGCCTLSNSFFQLCAVFYVFLIVEQVCNKCIESMNPGSTWTRNCDNDSKWTESSGSGWNYSLECPCCSDEIFSAAVTCLLWMIPTQQHVVFIVTTSEIENELKCHKCSQLQLPYWLPLRRNSETERISDFLIVSVLISRAALTLGQVETWRCQRKNCENVFLNTRRMCMCRGEVKAVVNQRNQWEAWLV